MSRAIAGGRRGADLLRPHFASEDGLYATPLADIIAAPPSGEIIEGAFTPQLTDAGRKHP